MPSPGPSVQHPPVLRCLAAEAALLPALAAAPCRAIPGGTAGGRILHCQVNHHMGETGGIKVLLLCGENSYLDKSTLYFVCMFGWCFAWN